MHFSCSIFFVATIPLYCSAQQYGNTFYQNINSENPLTQAFQRQNITPSVVEQPPPNLMTLCYPNGMNLYTAGLEVKPRDTADPPNVATWPTVPNTFYTFAMIDNSPNNQYANVGHWMVVNVPGNDISRGTTYIGYIKSAPEVPAVEQGTSGFHNYVFLAFAQTGIIPQSALTNAIPVEEIPRRLNYDLKAFLQQNSINPLPTSGTFYLSQAQPEDIAALLASRGGN